MFGLGLLETSLMLAIALFFVFWVAMLLHALVYEQSPRDRVFWVVLIFFTWIVGACAYACLRYPRHRSAGPHTPSSSHAGRNA